MDDDRPMGAVPDLGGLAGRASGDPEGLVLAGLAPRAGPRAPSRGPDGPGTGGRRSGAGGRRGDMDQARLNLGKAEAPAYTAASSSSSSMRSSWLYLATRSDRAGAPVLI